MANKTDASTPSEIVTEQAVAFINDLEGTGYDSVDYIVDRLGNSDAAVVAWCKTELGNELDVEEAWDEVTAWCEKENVPLKGKYRELCQKQTQEGIDGNNGNAWLADHETAVIRCALAESFDDGCRALLSEYGNYVHDMDMEGLPKVTNYQYLEAATEIVVLNAKQLVEKEGYKELFSWALRSDEGRLGNCQKLLKAFVERHPEHKVALVEALIDHPYIGLEEWLCTESWYLGLEEAFTIKAKEIYKKACVGWDCEGAEVLNELSTVVRQALAKGGVGSDEILDDAEVNAELAELKAVSPTPQVGAELLARVTAMEKAGVSSRDILIRTGYFEEDGDYGQANIDFFSAKLAATKEAGIAMNSRDEEVEEPSKEDIAEEVKTLLMDYQVGDIDLFNKASAYLVLDGKISGKVKEVISDFYKSIEAVSRYEDVLTKEEYSSIVEECLIKYVAKENNIEDPYFEFLSLYFAIDRIKGEPDSTNDWNTALVMMEFVKRHPEHPHLRKRFAEFMTNTTEAGMEHSAFLSFRSPVFDLIKEEHERFLQVDVNDILITDGNIIDNSIYSGEIADVLDEPQTIENLKQLGYVVKPRTAESIAKAAAELAEAEAKEQAERKAHQKEYDSVPKEQRELEDSFYTALDNCDFDKVFKESEKYKTLILENIDDLASNFAEDTPFEATGEEPQWLLSALLKAGAEFDGGGGGDDDDDDDDDDEIIYEKQPLEPAAKNTPEEPGTEFTGKRVCITGKLDTTRDVWEAWIKDAGGVVASSVSKTTDILIVGKDAGSKLDKAKELGINIIDESAAKFTLGFICEEIQEAWAELIIEKLLSGLPTIEGEGYFRINDGNNVYVENTDSITEIRDWLTDRIGANSAISEYSYPEEVEKLKVEWVKIDKTKNVTIVYYDEECGEMIKPEIAVFNTREDALHFSEEENSGWGGHLSTLRVITKEGDKITAEAGDETEFNSWDYDYERMFHTYNKDPRLLELVGGKERMQEIIDEKETEVLRALFREGKWPPIQEG